MTSRFFERRAVRNQIKAFLDVNGWDDLTWAEGFSASVLDVVKPPFISVMLDDLGKNQLEMGNDPEINKTFTRRLQITTFLESEDRVEALCDLVSDFLDVEVMIIKDNNNNVLGSMISDTSSILSRTEAPLLNQESNLDWEGTVVCMYEVHYPQG
jgi:hypothetical protein